ncbi:MAG TPA: ABC transporter substrate-binding protein [Xanthobacteraceae bacterium]|jgi:branched-chain amino acid transport system substrate-binding protein|nr:ABC transporter substrate-binding protein [Xanthobacteraceae bacterium]
MRLAHLAHLARHVICATLLAATPALAQQPLKIGLIMPYTGQFTDASAQMDDAIKLYVKQHGDTIAGRKIEFIRRDDSGSPDVAKRMARELTVNDNVDILAGFVITPEALAVADVSEQAKKFMVVMNAATAIITTKSPYIVRTSLTIPQLEEAFGTWVYKSGTRKVYTLVSDYAPGHDAEGAFQRAFKAAGGEIVGALRIPLANPDFSAFVQRIKDADPEALFIFVPGGAQPAALAKALVERGMDAKKIKILGQGEITEENALQGMGDAALGVITAYHYDHNHDSKLNKAFVGAFKAAYKRNPDIFAIGGYDGMHVIYEAVKKTGGKTDGDALIAAAKGLAWESPRGPISIDPQTRDIIQTVYFRRVEKVGGELRNVEFEKVENVKDPVKARMPQ